MRLYVSLSQLDVDWTVMHQNMEKKQLRKTCKTRQDFSSLSNTSLDHSTINYGFTLQIAPSVTWNTTPYGFNLFKRNDLTPTVSATVKNMSDRWPGFFSDHPTKRHEPRLGEHEEHSGKLQGVDDITLVLVCAALVAVSAEKLVQEAGGVEEDGDKAGQADVHRGADSLSHGVQSMCLPANQVQDGHDDVGQQQSWSLGWIENYIVFVSQNDQVKKIGILSFYINIHIILF